MEASVIQILVLFCQGVFYTKVYVYIYHGKESDPLDFW